MAADQRSSSGGEGMSTGAPATDEYDRRVTGERTSVDAGAVETGIEIACESSSVTFVPASDTVEVYLTGDRNSIEVRGDDETIILFLEGDSNSLTVGQGMDVRRELDDGSALSISREDFGAAEEPELIQRSKSEAYASLGWFGYDLVSYQEASEEREYCHYCGRDADTIVQRRKEKVLTCFGLNLTLSEVASSDECPHCTPEVEATIDLSDDERRQIFR